MQLRIILFTAMVSLATLTQANAYSEWLPEYGNNSQANEFNRNFNRQADELRQRQQRSYEEQLDYED